MKRARIIWWYWYHSSSSKSWGPRETPWRPNCWSHPRSGPEIKDRRRRAKNDTPKRLRTCSWCSQALQAEFLYVLSCIGNRTKESCGRGSEVGRVQSRKGRKGSSPL